jgi:hypothetical protein
MPRRPAHGAEASSSHAVLPAPDVVVVRLEQERDYAGAPLAHLDEALADQRCAE